MKTYRPNRLKIFIFSFIGVFNTLFDIVVYIVILNVSHSIIIANLSATSLALIGSYLLNSRLTFKSKKWTFGSFAAFVGVTVFGLWVLQTAAIYVFTHLISFLPTIYWHFFGHYQKTAQQLVPKLLATAITLVWNYLWYNKVIFRDGDRDQANRLAASDL